MAIFGKDRARQVQGHGTTIIAADSELVGNLTLSDDLHVDGRTEGDISSKATIVVGAEGRIQGQIKARNVIVSGHVEGNIETERLEIIAGGSVQGQIQTVDLVIEPGGRFNGTSEILDPARQKASAPEREKPAAETGDGENRVGETRTRAKGQIQAV